MLVGKSVGVDHLDGFVDGHWFARQSLRPYFFGDQRRNGPVLVAGEACGVLPGALALGRPATSIHLSVGHAVGWGQDEVDSVGAVRALDVDAVLGAKRALGGSRSVPALCAKLGDAFDGKLGPLGYLCVLLDKRLDGLCDAIVVDACASLVRPGFAVGLLSLAGPLWVVGY